MSICGRNECAEKLIHRLRLIKVGVEGIKEMSSQ